MYITLSIWAVLSTLLVVGSGGLILMAYDAPWGSLTKNEKIFTVVLTLLLLPGILVGALIMLIICALDRS